MRSSLGGCCFIKERKSESESESKSERRTEGNAVVLIDLKTLVLVEVE